MNKDEEFDKKLKAALSVPVPEGLADKIIANTYQQELIEERVPLSQKLKKKYKQVSAGILMLSTIASVSFFSLNLHSDFEDKILNEVLHHQDYFSKNIIPSNDDINYAVVNYGLNESIVKKLKNLSSCAYKKHKGIHFVLGEGNERAIIHFYPDIEQENDTFSKDGFKGIFYNTDKGVFVIISNENNNFETAINTVNLI